MEESFNIYDPVLPYYLIFIPDYKEGEGLIIFICSHARIDGVSFISAIQNMSKD
jgi:hypothetical protein